MTLRVHRGETLVGRAWAFRKGELTAEMWLAAGDYIVSAGIGALRGSTSFAVVAAGGPPVLVALH